MKPHFSLFALLWLLAGCGPTPPAPPPPQASARPQPPPIIAEREAVVSKGVIRPGTPAVKVALLLPLSGESAGVGSSMLDAATMALYDSYLAVPSDRIRSQIILLPRDAGKTPAEAARAARDVLDQGATFIVGPLFSQSVSAVAPLARQRGVPVLTFSNNQAVAGNGVFVFGFLPEQLVQRVADYAFLRNVQRVALLAPNDAYGEKIQKTLAEIYAKKGGLLSPTEFYAPSPTNIDAAAGRLAATYNNTPEERRFQAIFIADGGNQLRNIVSSLKKTNIDLKTVRLLGAGSWDDPTLSQIPELRGALFAAPPPDAYQDFERRFLASYNYKPSRLTGLAYDALTLLAAVTRGNDETTIDTAVLLDPQGFLSPANGLFRLRPDGTTERRLTVMEVAADGFRIVEPAQKVFEQ